MWLGIEWVAIMVSMGSILASSYMVVLLRKLHVGPPLHDGRTRSRSNSGNAKTLALLQLCLVMFVTDGLYCLKFGASLTANVRARSLPGGPQPTPAGLCTLAGFVGQACGLATVLFNLAIALDLYRTVRAPFTHKTQAHVRGYAVAVLLAALAAGVAPLPADAYGDSGDGTCWIKPDYERLQYTFFVPLFITEALCVAVLLLFLRRSCEERWQRAGGQERRHFASSSLKGSQNDALTRRMAIFTSFFILSWLPQCVLRAWQWGHPREVPPQELVAAGLLTNSAIGLIDAFVRRKRWGTCGRGPEMVP
eukprot:g2776.t1